MASKTPWWIRTLSIKPLYVVAPPLPHRNDRALGQEARAAQHDVIAGVAGVVDVERVRRAVVVGADGD